MIEIEFDINQVLNKSIGELTKAQQQFRIALKKALHESGALMIKSVDDNFRAGGRPAWQPLKKATIAQRRQKSSKPLMDTGHLRNSITMNVDGDSVKVGTNVEYAPYHQFGAIIPRKARHQTIAFDSRGRFLSRAKAGRRKTTVRVAFANIPAGQSNLPARPFLLFQKQDMERIDQIFAKRIGEAYGTTKIAPSPNGGQ